MLGINSAEFAVLAVVALLVLGPKEAITLIKQIRSTWRKLQELLENLVQQELPELRRAVNEPITQKFTTRNPKKE